MKGVEVNRAELERAFRKSAEGVARDPRLRRSLEDQRKAKMETALEHKLDPEQGNYNEHKMP